MRDPAGASFLFRMAKAARKYATGLTVITQDAADLLGTDLGQAVVANAATQVLMRQAPQAIDAIAEAFGLSAGERQILLTAPQGRGLLLAGGSDRVAFQSIASPGEDALANSTPDSIAGRFQQSDAMRSGSVLADPDDPYGAAEEAR
jgi:type IV secretory pathway VirB4 component